MLLSSFSLYAQVDEALELDEAGMEINPDSAPEAAAPTEAAKTTDEEKADEDEPIAVAPTEPYIPLVEAPKTEAQTPPSAKIETDVSERKRFSPTESHWYTTFGFEGMEYDLPFAYNGDKEDFKPEQRQLYGGRLGFGGEIYLGIGFLTSTRIEAYYMGTLFESAKTAAPEEEDEDVATVKDTGQIYGGDIVQTLSFIWELKTKNPIMEEMTYLTVEPFIEAGIGRAWAFNKKDYSYDAATIEEYDQSFTDELTNTKLGAGINLTSRAGYFLYLKATQNRYDITKRRTKGYYYANGDPRSEVDPNPSTDLEPIMIYSLGGGYKF